MQQDNSEQVIIDPRLIARHYIRTWFFLDLISSIPLDYVFLIFNSLTGNGVRDKSVITIFIDYHCLSHYIYEIYNLIDFMLFTGLPRKLPNFARWSGSSHIETGQTIEFGTITPII